MLRPMRSSLLLPFGIQVSIVGLDGRSGTSNGTVPSYKIFPCSDLARFHVPAQIHCAMGAPRSQQMPRFQQRKFENQGTLQSAHRISRFHFAYVERLLQRVSRCILSSGSCTIRRPSVSPSKSDGNRMPLRWRKHAPRWKVYLSSRFGQERCHGARKEE